MAAPTIIRSTDGGAPSLNGTVGSMVSVLDYCLVTTLGWGKPFTGTNAASYRPPASSAMRHYLDVADNTGTSFAARGYETMSALATGTGPFPTTTQVASMTITKSGTADATARPWICFGDDRTFYLHWVTAVTTFGPWSLSMLAFGEFVSVLAGDNYRTVLIRNLAWGCNVINSGTSVANIQAFMPRNYVGASAAAAHANPFYHGTLGNTGSLGFAAPRGMFPFPNPADGGLYVARVGLAEFGTGTSPVQDPLALRGRLRGVNQVGHPSSSFAEGDTFDGVGEFSGKSFLITKFSTTNTCAAYETTAWDVST